MYEYFHQHVVNIGGDFHAFNMVRKGRVIYAANTNQALIPSPRPFRHGTSARSRQE